MGKPLARVAVLVPILFWLAILNTRLQLPQGGSYSMVFGPFDTSEQCLALLRTVLVFYDPKSSGVPIIGSFCVNPETRTIIYP